MDEQEEKGAVLRAEKLAMLLSATLDALEEGVVVLDGDSRVAYWNLAATSISGYAREAQIGRASPPGFYRLDARHQEDIQAHAEAQEPVHGHFATSEVNLLAPDTSVQAPSCGDRPVLVELRHKAGHMLPAMLRRTALRDELGMRFGTLLRFHPAEDADQLPHGESGEGVGVEHSQADLEDRLDQSWRDWTSSGVSFGLLWITVDQAERLRKTHGRDACEAMLQSVIKTLRHGLKPTEILGRWGDNEFLVLAHERTAEMLKAHATHLLGLARTAEFKWWGDRVTLTVSIGAAQANGTENLSTLLKLAQKAMQTSIFNGGNRVTDDHNTRGRACSQS